MFAKIAQFFIENSKLSFVIILVILITWIWSYLIIPKQYNPTIVVPAFNIFVWANWLDSNETSRLIVSPLENKIMELEWIDEVYWSAWDNYWAVMAKFNVWVDKEKAKIRLIQKIRENMNLKPLWVSEPIIKTIDPDELAQVVFAITSKNEKLTKEQNYIYLRQIANLIKQKVKTVDNITTLEIVWWEKNNLIIDLDLEKIEAKNVDIMSIYDALQKNNLNLPVWNINNSSEKIFIEATGKITKPSELKKLIVWNISWNIIYLEDVAKIRYWIKNLTSSSSFSSRDFSWETVFIWFWKQVWTNAVTVTDAISKKIEEVKKTLPKDIEIVEISNEWKKASNATNMLLINLVQSIIIVFFVLAFYLWAKDAFNTAVSIPLTLAFVFVLALMFWENINKITLFALILVLWMLVDNSTVVVENISRHLQERPITKVSKLQAVLNWTQEVWAWVIMATIARLLAFASMFAVTWMMWEYMNPIPKFAIRALLISLGIAFTINPLISFLWAKDINHNEKDSKNNSIENNWESRFKIRKKYLEFLRIFIWEWKSKSVKRKIFKLVFWISLFVIILWPIYAWIFKARMLPKSNQNQIYIWADAPRNWNLEKIEKVKTDINTYLLKNIKEVKNITSTSWQAYIWDFANLFRWWLNRVWEHELSMRINLFTPKEFEKKYNNPRDNSEAFTIKLRKKFKKFILTNYPDLKIRLLEDPPGPPVRSTFLAMIKSDASEKNIEKFRQKVEKEIIKISKKYSLADIWNSNSTTYKKINIKLNQENISRNLLTSKQVEYSLAIAINWLDVNLIKNKDSFETTNIILKWNKIQTNNIDFLKKITFTNKNWIKVPLSSIAEIKYNFVAPTINTDKREKTDYIYAEMWDDSLVYPTLRLFTLLKSKEFLNWEYKVKNISPYKMEYIWISDWKDYTLEWSWEWKLTMDTFRDLGLAMAISLLAIYFLLVWQFASFRVSWVIMITFLLWFFWVFPWFTFLYLFQNEYFSATSMIWIIALAWIVVWNAIILIDYLNVLKENWLTIAEAVLKAWYVRFAPIILTSLTTVFWAATIVWDPVWSWLAWAIIWWLLVSSVLTLIVIPIFYYDSQKNEWD